MSEPRQAADGWTEQRATIVRHQAGEAVMLPVSSTDHPGAIATAVQAHRAALAYQHLHELREVGAQELRALLLDIIFLRQVVEYIEANVTVAYREAGASWAELGSAMCLSRQSAKERYLRLADPDRAPGCPVDADPDAQLEWIRSYAVPETAGLPDVEAMAFAVAVQADHLSFTEEAMRAHDDPDS